MLSVTAFFAATLLAPYTLRYSRRCPACRRRALRLVDEVELAGGGSGGRTVRNLARYRCTACGWAGARERRRWTDIPPDLALLAPTTAAPLPPDNTAGRPIPLAYGRAPDIDVFLHIPHEDGGFTIYCPPEGFLPSLFGAVFVGAWGAVLLYAAITGWFDLRLGAPVPVRSLFARLGLALVAAFLFLVVIQFVRGRHAHTVFHLHADLLRVTRPSAAGPQTRVIDLRGFCDAKLDFPAEASCAIDFIRADGSMHVLPLAARCRHKMLVFGYLRDYLKTRDAGDRPTVASLTSTPAPPPISPESSPPESPR